jgi:hypothetical protein
MTDRPDSDLGMARDERGHGCFAVDLDGQVHGFISSIRDNLISRGVLYQDADHIWRLRWHGFDLRRESAAWMAACDFCSARPVAWNIPCESFRFPTLRVAGREGPPSFSEGDWAACDPCGSDIAANRREALLARAQGAEWSAHTGGVPLMRELRVQIKRTKQELHRRFWQHYTGGAVRIAVSTYGH